MTPPPHPSLARIASVARALGDLASEVVFIGGAIAPLLQTDPAIPRVRPTDDVDALMATTGYATFGGIEARLRALGFRTEATPEKHVHRWLAPDGTPFDLVPIGEHLGGTGGVWDRVAFDTAVTTEIEPGLTIRHAGAPGFLALKWAAFRDRGIHDPFQSEDLEDIMALLVSRDTIVSEFRGAPGELQQFIRDAFHWLAENPDYEDLVAACLGNAMAYTHTSGVLRSRLREMMDA